MLSSTFLNAAVYVRVGKTQNKDVLDYAYSKFKKMNMKIFYNTKLINSKRTYTIYSGPYNSKKVQQIALNNSKIFFKNSKLVNMQNKSNAKDTKESKTYSKGNSYYVGSALGYGMAPSTHVIKEGTITIDEPKNSGINFLLYAGYNMGNDFSFSINFLRMDADDLVFDNMYGLVSYKFAQINGFEPNFGVSLGSSSLKWSKAPIEDSTASNNNSEDILYGTQLGVKYEGFKNLTPFIQYHCMFMKHNTNLTYETQNKSELKHKTLHSVLLGLEYSF
jgi:hypothetical protein